MKPPVDTVLDSQEGADEANENPDLVEVVEDLPWSYILRHKGRTFLVGKGSESENFADGYKSRSEPWVTDFLMVCDRLDVKELPYIIIDKTAPKELVPVIAYHEIQELENGGRGFHAVAVERELEYARRTLSGAIYQVYEKYSDRKRNGELAKDSSSNEGAEVSEEVNQPYIINLMNMVLSEGGDEGRVVLCKDGNIPELRAASISERLFIVLMLYAPRVLVTREIEDGDYTIDELSDDAFDFLLDGWAIDDFAKVALKQTLSDRSKVRKLVIEVVVMGDELVLKALVKKYWDAITYDVELMEIIMDISGMPEFIVSLFAENSDLDFDCVFDYLVDWLMQYGKYDLLEKFLDLADANLTAAQHLEILQNNSVYGLQLLRGFEADRHKGDEEGVVKLVQEVARCLLGKNVKISIEEKDKE